jgi:hypothetical protein
MASLIYTIKHHLRQTQSLVITVKRLLLVAICSAMLSSCVANVQTFKAYIGEVNSQMQTSVIRGGQLVRNDLMNRYVDVVRFLRVDDMELRSSEQIAAVEVVPGYREIEVYYSWDHGSQRGLAPALVDYAAAQTSVSRVLRFTALPGEVYTVHAEPTFLGERQDITTLAAVDFWVEDSVGKAVVPSEQARIQPVL